MCPGSLVPLDLCRLTDMPDMLVHTSHLPPIEFEAGDTIIREGAAGGSIWVLVSGVLHVRKDNVVVNVITRPGAVVGEISALLNTPYTATVHAAERSVLRCAKDGSGLLASEPAITTLVAKGLAERLYLITTYLVDLKHQYGDEPGLSMIPDVLRQLLQPQPNIRTGSARDPDPEY